MNQQSEPVESIDHPMDQADTSVEPAVASVTRTPLFEAVSAARYQRQEIIKQIETSNGCPLICYVSGRECAVGEDDTMPFVDLLHNVPPGRGLDLLLHTHGGSIDVAEKLIRMVRSRAGPTEIRIIVPEFAKSAGTLMVLGADSVVMSDMSELGPIDPQMQFPDSYGNIRQQPVQNYLDAFDEYVQTLKNQPNDVAAQIMLAKLDPATVKLCQAVNARARQSAEHLLRDGMFRNNDGNWSKTADELLDTKRWLSHSQMISWKDAQHPDIGLTVEYMDQQSERWQKYWRLYCLQRLAIDENQKLFESDYASLVIDGLRG